MPDVTLQPGDFILFWADDDEEQGPNHTNFKLDSDGEEIGIFDSEFTSYFPLDTLTYGPQSTDISFGCNPDGGQVWMLYTDPTPGFSNLLGAVNEENFSSDKILVYPNPVTDGRVHFNKTLNLKLYNSAGQFILSKERVDHLDVNGLPVGLYFLVFENGTSTKIQIR